MHREPIVFVGTSDLSGHFRGKSFPAADLPARLQRGVGLAPTNIFMSAFGPIPVTTFGTPGQVFLISGSTPPPRFRSIRGQHGGAFLSGRHQNSGRYAVGFLSAPRPAPCTRSAAKRDG